MPFPVAAIIGGSIISGLFGKKSADAAADSSAATVAESRRQFDTARADLLPTINLGQGASQTLQRLLGLYAAPTQYPSSAIAQPSGSGAGSSAISEWLARHTRGGIGDGTPGVANPVATQPTQQPTGPDMSVFYESPDYQFNLGEGQKAIDRSLAARGKALSGAGVREGVRYASGLASREYGSFVDRLLAAAGLGTTGAAASANAGANSAATIGAANQAAGNARASGYQSLNNAVQGGISNILLAKYLGQ